MRHVLSGALAAVAAAVWTIPAMAGEASVPEIDLLAFSNGALVELASPSYGSGWDALWLIDEDPTRGWASLKDHVGPAEFTLSLAERSRISRVGFSTASVEQPEEAAKDVEVLVSDQSASTGFVSVARVTLARAEDNQSFALPTPATGRWVKFIVSTNYGATNYTEIMDLHAFGEPLATTPLPNVSGTYSSEAYGKFHLAQEGAQLTGCYEHQKGLVQGGLESHLMRLTWSENAGTQDATGGPVVMVLSRDGRGFQGLWRTNDGAWNDNWTLRKVSAEVGSCPHWKPASPKGNIVATSLAGQGRVRLYGINFDTDSDKPRADAKPALDQLVAALKANPAWSVTVEGHTDTSSTPAHNLDLSRRRANAVKTYLSAAGVPADHVAAVGFGQDQPVASNDTALGRAQNRRVEVAR